MPPGPVPPKLEALLREPNPCVIATLRPDGELHRRRPTRLQISSTANNCSSASS